MSNFANSQRENKFFSIFLSLIFFVLLIPGIAVADPVLTIGGDLTPFGALEIGGDLEVNLTGASPGQKLTFTLLDEAGNRVAAARWVEADMAGDVQEQLLWTNTGLVGCDPDAVHDPSNYQFLSLEEAKTILNGRTWWVQVTPSGAPFKVYDEVEVDMRAIQPFIEGFASDGAGCFRSFLEWGEPLHVSLRHWVNADIDVQLYLVEAQDTWMAGDPVVDVRGAPQVVTIPAGLGYHVELLWLFPLEGDYQVILRPLPGGTHPFQEDVDLVLFAGKDIGVGARSSDCGGVCPP